MARHGVRHGAGHCDDRAWLLRRTMLRYRLPYSCWCSDGARRQRRYDQRLRPGRRCCVRRRRRSSCRRHEERQQRREGRRWTAVRGLAERRRRLLVLPRRHRLQHLRQRLPLRKNRRQPNRPQTINTPRAPQTTPMVGCGAPRWQHGFDPRLATLLAPHESKDLPGKANDANAKEDRSEREGVRTCSNCIS